MTTRLAPAGVHSSARERTTASTRTRAIVTGAATVALLISAWELTVRWTGTPEFILPAPSQIVDSGLASAGLLGAHIATTTTEAVLGLALGTVAGWLLAMLASLVPTTGHVAQPLVLLSQTVPTVVLAPLLILWAGYGLTGKVILVALTVFFPVFISAAAAIRDVDGTHADTVAGLGGGPLHQWWIVRLPASIPGALAGLRIAATYAVGAAVVSEYLAGESGIGVYIQRSRKAYAVDQIFVGIVLIAALSALFVIAISLLRRVAMPWHVAQRPA